jgi:hypothetical protein
MPQTDHRKDNASQKLTQYLEAQQQKKAEFWQKKYGRAPPASTGLPYP